MYTSRLAFNTLPGKTHQVEEHLKRLAALVGGAGGVRPRVLRTHFASLGAPDIVFEQEAADLATLEHQIEAVTGSPEFQELSNQISGLLGQPPKREIYRIVD